MRTSIVGAISACSVLTAMLVAPAHAERFSVDDPADATASLSDIFGLEVRHRVEDLVVRVSFNELDRASAAGVLVFVDVDRDRRGPEFVLSSGLGDGAGYALATGRGWRGSSKPIECEYRAQPRWGREVFAAQIARDCLGDPAQVRVSVKMVDLADGSHSVIDWVPAPRRWSLALAPGNTTLS